MSDLLTLDAEVRTDKGKGASRRLRREDKVPAILYGSEQEPVSLTLDHDKVVLSANTEAFYSHILTLTIDGKPTQALLKDMQRHPYKAKILHLDFQRVDATHEISTQIPLHFINEDKNAAIKAGGIATHFLTEVEVRCLPANLPEFIEVDIAELGMSESLHLSHLVLPKDVDLVALQREDDQAVVGITAPASTAADEEADAEVAAAAAAESAEQADDNAAE